MVNYGKSLVLVMMWFLLVIGIACCFVVCNDVGKGGNKIALNIIGFFKPMDEVLALNDFGVDIGQRDADKDKNKGKNKNKSKKKGEDKDKNKDKNEEKNESKNKNEEKNKDKNKKKNEGKEKDKGEIFVDVKMVIVIEYKCCYVSVPADHSLELE